MKPYYRVFTRNGEYFDFHALAPMMTFVVNARIEGGFLQDALFLPFDQMRMIIRIEVQTPIQFMPPAGTA